MFKVQIIFLLLVSSVFCYTNPSLCTASTSYYSPTLLACTTCPTNTQQSTADFTHCNCTTSFSHNPSIIGVHDSSACQTLGSTYSTATQVASVYALDGSVSQSIVTCVDSYPNIDNTRCIPCGQGMTYSTALETCTCTAANQYPINGFCYGNTSAFVQTQSITVISDYLAQQQVVIGCEMHQLHQPCNLLLNKCAEKNYSSTNFFCSKLASLTITNTNGLPTYSFSSAITASIGLAASSIPGTNSTSTKNTFDFALVEYNADGSIHDIKSLDDSILPCYLSQQDLVDFMSYGNLFRGQCANRKTFTTTYYYDVYVIDSQGRYNEVPVLIGDSYYKRFTPSQFREVTLVLTSQPSLLQTPYLILKQNPGNNQGTIITSSEAASYSIVYAPFLAIFMVGMLVVLIINFVKYLHYNPDQHNDPYYCFKVIGYLFIYMIKYIAICLFLWCFCLSAYCFCFYKFQQTVFLVLPQPPKQQFYKQFEAFYWTSFSFMFLALIVQAFRLVNNTDYFLIDWEKEKQMGKFDIGKNKKEVSVWRKVLLVNELYELSVSRIVSLQVVILVSLLFLEGLEWIHLNFMIPNTLTLVADQVILANPVLSYFIITFVTLTTAFVQFIIRVAVKIWIPLPIENFIDLCSVSNISVIMFDEQLHGYYIHGMNPLGQSEGSLSDIESMFEKQARAFGKSRSFRLQDADQCQTFEVIFPMDIRQAFKIKYKSPMNKVVTSKDYHGGAVLGNPVPEEMTEEDYRSLDEINIGMLESFKYYLQGVKTSQMNVRERSFCEKIVSCPSEGELTGKLPVFYKDTWYQFSNTMLTGHQMLLLFYFVNFTNAFYIALGNIYYALLLAVIVQTITEMIIKTFVKRNISKNTMIDEKFFN